MGPILAAKSERLPPIPAFQPRGPSSIDYGCNISIVYLMLRAGSFKTLRQNPGPYPDAHQAAPTPENQALVLASVAAAIGAKKPLAR